MEITDKATLYEMKQRKVREEAFQKLKAAIHWKEAEKEETIPTVESEDDKSSSADSFFDKKPIPVKKAKTQLKIPAFKKKTPSKRLKGN